MSNLFIKNKGFDSFKSGMLVVAFSISVLLLFANLFLGFIATLLSFVLASFETGIEIDKKNGRYRYYKSFFSKTYGTWLSFEKYKVFVILKRNLKGQVLSPKLVSAINYKSIVYEVNLTTKSHRAKIPLKRYKDLESAKKFTQTLQKKLNLPLEVYSPVISEKTRLRRARK